MLDAKVLEVAFYYPVPFCTRILASLGAEVTKIEPPYGDPARMIGEMYTVFNFGKKIIRIDLKTEEGKKKFLELAEKSDVIVEGLRPGTAKKLGIDYETVSKINPVIIYCSISAFGQKSKLSKFPAHDLNILGLTGILEICGKGEFIDPNIQFADFASSMIAVIAILSALIERERTGVGKRIDISMLRSAIFGIPVHLTSLINGLGMVRELTRNPGYDVYRTKDGYITLGIVTEEHFWKRLCNVLGIPNITLLEAMNDYKRIKEEIEKRIAVLTTKEAVEKLRFADIPVFEVYRAKEIEKLEEVLGESLIDEIEFEGRKTKIIRFPW
ncbi:MAG: CaiB/BaiF CoA-transferase family protein [Archaeoglobaceae archaeon]|nr:CoA transferase [Archaeoglobaceae archaeon]MDW7990171.1 CaiB/BaiF CoA-transferase family protein [Archaeoglobaceae archaeon]